jgi:dTDP-4-dehydrorhamnose reductase
VTRRWVVLGSAGQLGISLVRFLESAPDSEVVAALDLPEVDIGDRESVARAVADAEGGPPDFVVNAAAFTHVDRCESEPELAQRANAIGPEVVAEVCREAGARLAHVSTDYVFDGRSSAPRREDDPVGPLSVYGQTKLAGERAVLESSAEFLVVRTSWLFGPGRNFVVAILEQARRGRLERRPAPLRVVDDQLGSPTYAADLAQGTLQLLSEGRRGLYHLANADAATWWDLARAALDECGHGDLEIARIRTDELNLPAPRPRYSLLDVSKAASAGVKLRSWRAALSAYLGSPDAAALRKESEQ